MGVSCIVLWDPPDPGMDLSTAVITLQKKMDKIRAKHCANPPKIMHLVHTSEYPCTSFAVMEKAPAPGSPSASAVGNCLVADHAFDLIMQNLKGFYAPRKGQKMEAKGNRYQCDHYIVKIASVTYGANNRGILVEVEDKETTVIADCWDSLARFVQVLLQQTHPPTPPSKSPTELEYTPTDRALNYIQIFGKLRKGTR